MTSAEAATVTRAARTTRRRNLLLIDRLEAEPKSPEKAPRAGFGDPVSKARAREARHRTARWFALTPPSSSLLLWYFFAFFLAASAARMDAALAAALEADEGEGEGEGARGFARRATPTRRALLAEPSAAREVPSNAPAAIPSRPSDEKEKEKALEEPPPSRVRTRLFAPLTVEASATYTALEWVRFGATRYATELGLMSTVALGTSSRDVLHGGYLALALAMLRARDAVLVRGDEVFRWLRYYNLFALFAQLAFQAPLFFDQIGSESPCSASHILGLYNRDQESGAARGRGGGLVAGSCRTLLRGDVPHAVALESPARAEVLEMERATRRAGGCGGRGGFARGGRGA